MKFKSISYLAHTPLWLQIILQPFYKDYSTQASKSINNYLSIKNALFCCSFSTFNGKMRIPSKSAFSDLYFSIVKPNRWLQIAAFLNKTQKLIFFPSLLHKRFLQDLLKKSD